MPYSLTEENGLIRGVLQGRVPSAELHDMITGLEQLVAGRARWPDHLVADSPIVTGFARMFQSVNHNPAITIEVSPRSRPPRRGWPAAKPLLRSHYTDAAMRDRPLVTVVLASYNHARFVVEAVESVLNQTVRDLELVVVDDGSTDGTVERVQAIRDPRLSLYCNDCNRGRHSRNWAIARTRGMFVAIQNSDDRWHPDKLADQLQFLEGRPDHGLCFTAVDLCDDSGSPCPEHPIFGQLWRTEQHDRFGWLRRFFLTGNCLAHASVLMRRKLLNEIGLYDPALFQLPDLDLWIRAASVTELAVLPRALTTVRIHGGNLSAPSLTASQRHARELTEVLRRYGAPPILQDVARIFGLDRAGCEEDGADEVWNLARLGRYADARPEPHLRLPAIHFLREALRRSDERDLLPAEGRGRLALDLVRASGRPREADVSGLSERAGRIVELAVRAIGRTWRG